MDICYRISWTTFKRANVKVLEIQDCWFGVTYKEIIQKAFAEFMLGSFGSNEIIEDLND